MSHLECYFIGSLIGLIFGATTAFGVRGMLQAWRYNADQDRSQAELNALSAAKDEGYRQGYAVALQRIHPRTEKEVPS